MLKKNVVLFPADDNAPFDAPHRVLHIIGTEVVLFRLQLPLGKPFHHDTSTVAGWLKSGLLRTDHYPLPAYIRPDTEVPEQDREKRDALWTTLEPLVTGDNELIIFDRGSRWRLIVRRAKETGYSSAYLLRILQRFWQFGQVPNALLPAYMNSGGKGKTKSSDKKKRGRPRNVVLTGHDPTAIGVNVTRNDLANIATSIKLFHLRQGKSFAATRDEMISRYYSVPRVVDGEIIRVPLPDSQLIQRQAFLYWAKKLLADSTLQHEVLQDSFWQKRLRGRSGKAWQKTIGPTDVFEIDATVGNFYLISEFNPNHLIGRPVIYFVVDRRSSMVVGMHIGLEGPSWNAARLALMCAFSSKVDYCRKYGTDITEADWPACELPNIVVADNAELLGEDAERSLQNFLKIDSEFNPVGIPVGKGTVESKFMTVLEKVSWVPGAWKARAAEHDCRKDLDLRWDAKLTLRDLTQIVIEEVLHHNNAIRVEHLRTKEMIQANVEPYRRNIYLWGLEHESGDSVRYPDHDALRRCLLPSKLCSLTESGLEVDGAHYLPTGTDLETMLASARRRRKRLRVHYDNSSDNEVYVINDVTKEWEIWRLSRFSSVRYANMRREELLELAATIKLSVHDANDHLNRETAIKNHHQSEVVSKAKQRKKAAGPIKNKRDYLASQPSNRSREVMIENAIESAVEGRHKTGEAEQPTAEARMISRRNNVVALRRKSKEGDA